MANEQAFDDLDAIIKRIRALPQLVEHAGPVIAEECKAELDRTIAAGTDAYGTPWPVRKDTGAQALTNAAAAITVRAQAGTVYIRIRGIEARHHLGQVRGRVKRNVIPIKVLPRAMAERITKALTRLFRVSTGQGST